jgi:peptidoglycan/xylan/chitin deacetylase (PgdA/CDA1 family)
MSKQEHPIDLHDSLCLLKMDWARFVCKQVLPRGYWGQAKPEAPDDKTLYLTFDDGPNASTTLQLLDILDENDVKATFFVMGSRTQKAPELVAEMAKRGHAIGNHTFNHLFLPGVPTNIIETEIGKTNAAIKTATGSDPVLFRPPYGFIDWRAASVLKEQQLKTVYWGAVSEDWLGIGEKRVINRTMRRLQHGTLIVLHEGKRISKQTLSATREIIKLSKLNGYTFKTVPVA